MKSLYKDEKNNESYSCPETRFDTNILFFNEQLQEVDSGFFGSAGDRDGDGVRNEKKARSM